MSDLVHSNKGEYKKCENCKCFDCSSNSGYLCKDCGQDTCYTCEDDENIPYCKRDLKVYKMDDYEWWITDKSLEETIETFCNEYGIDREELEPEECNIDTDGMWVEATEEEIANNPKYNDGNPKIGEIEKLDGLCVFVSFREAIKRLGYQGVGCIASTEW